MEILNDESTYAASSSSTTEDLLINQTIHQKRGLPWKTTQSDDSILQVQWQQWSTKQMTDWKVVLPCAAKPKKKVEMYRVIQTQTLSILLSKGGKLNSSEVIRKTSSQNRDPCFFELAQKVKVDRKTVTLKHNQNIRWYAFHRFPLFCAY